MINRVPQREFGSQLQVGPEAWHDHIEINKVKIIYSSAWKPVSELQSVSCHTG